MHKQLFEQCEREQLQLSGAIQPHGTLLVVDGHGRISHAAINVAAFLGKPPEQWLGQPLPTELAHLVGAVASGPGSRRSWTRILGLGLGLLDVVVSRGHGGTATVELTRHLTNQAEPPAAGRVPPAPLILNEAMLAAARQALTERIADLTGFQRVMYYAFREEGDGEVIAEARRGEAYGSYLGLRFPASDIPNVARQLYVKNPWRCIPDINAEPVALAARDGDTPDLTWSDLRSVSLVHRVYLANMRVRASLSFPVVTGGNLTALIAAHHKEKRQSSLALLEYAGALVRAHAMAVWDYQSARYSQLLEGLSRRFEETRQRLYRRGEFTPAWPDLAAWLMEEFRADGATLCRRDKCLDAGETFEAPARAAVDGWFRRQQGDVVWAGDNLPRQIPRYPASAIAGVLALRIHEGDELRLYLTRREETYEVAWGGNPDKPVEIQDGILNIAPRRSFDKWVEKRQGYSRSWDSESRLLALKLGGLLHREIPELSLGF